MKGQTNCPKPGKYLCHEIYFPISGYQNEIVFFYVDKQLWTLVIKNVIMDFTYVIMQILLRSRIKFHIHTEELWVISITLEKSTWNVEHYVWGM